ncbi:FtsW/RodA/SpoVE family cell cycle protein [Pontibacter sp. G13]|uniref:FtsW/RodA/SpoVE family cell cycle protein n=1 Tax=Pontibacter sp. G13 TaxID=3074898 RepID=UPI00288A5E84|nr:FtsW/RodA/SpoVE family cell cycle protein [Pontibacter sp. G13]WNJ20255.1 FtsW/RodA/SpoVE family cell cycle protein [Pontibacter sp. G13]
MIRWLLFRLQGDKVIWVLFFLISLIGMLAVYSASSSLAFRAHGGAAEYLLLKHGGHLLIGFIVAFVIHLLDYRIFARFTNALLFITIPLLVFTIAQGSEVNEAARWIEVFGQTFQTSDLAKITLIVYLAKLLTMRQEVIRDFTEGFLPALFWVTVICGLIAPSDLSTAALMFLASLMVMFIAGVDLKYMGLLVLVALMGLSIMFSTAKRAQTWKSRIDAYVERIFDNEFNGDHQTLQAHLAIRTGGLLGKGSGNSTQRNFLPSANADYVFAIIVEEYGWVGGTFVIILYLLLLLRAVSVATMSKTFGALLAAGLAFLLVLQAMMNMGVTVGLLPVTGLTLPFISWGGTSILVSSVMMGIILSVSRDVVNSQKKTKGKSSSSRLRPTR